jgi:drug/metabolite transporter (DMT)-like permease
LTQQRENTVGVIYLVLTALCWGFVAAAVKSLTAKVDPYTISFSRVSMAVIVFSLFLRRRNWRRIGWFLP